MRACLQWKLAPAAVFCGMRTDLHTHVDVGGEGRGFLQQCPPVSRIVKVCVYVCVCVTQSFCARSRARTLIYYLLANQRLGRTEQIFTVRLYERTGGGTRCWVVVVVHRFVTDYRPHVRRRRHIKPLPRTRVFNMIQSVWKT